MNRSIEEIKQDMLANVSNTEDKSENSFIHDALAPASMEFFTFNRALEDVGDKLDVENLEGGELERYIHQRMPTIERKRATKSVATVTITGEEGTLINQGDLVATETLDFEVAETVTIGPSGGVDVKVECTEFGSAGNVPSGAINIFPVSIIGTVSVININEATGGYDEENDRSLLDRYLERARNPATAGNEHHYRGWAKEVTGVGDARVISLWAGNGTVKVVIIDSDNQPVLETLVNEVYEHIEDKRPPGSKVTVASAKPKLINVSLALIIDENFTLEQVKSKLNKSIYEYLQVTAFNVDFISYARIGKAILETEGVLDYSNLKVNNSMKNVDLEYEEVPTLGEVLVSE